MKRSISLTPAPPAIEDATYPDDCNFVDAAIAELNDSENFDLTVLEIGAAVYDTINPVLGMTVEKFGQTTDQTVGVITDFPYNTVLPYPVEGDVIMCDCFRIEGSGSGNIPVLSSGDSGSIVFLQDDASPINQAVGLLFGGWYSRRKQLGGSLPHHNRFSRTRPWPAVHRRLRRIFCCPLCRSS